MKMNSASIAQALCESLTLCRSAGISDETYFEPLSRNVALSGLSELKEPKLREHDYTAQFSLKHMAKDLRLPVETAQDLSLLLGQTEHLKEAYDQGRGRVEEL